MTNIRDNTKRYISYFEVIADEFLPVSRVAHREHDVFDFLQRHRVQGNTGGSGGLGAEQGGQPFQNDLPKRLTRRFEVAIIPPQSERPRNIREIKATGKF